MTPEVDYLCGLTLRVGKIVMEVRGNDFEVEYKSNESPLTMADLEANRLLREHLTKRYPGYGWLSEETHDRPDRLGKKHVWIIDPISTAPRNS